MAREVVVADIGGTHTRFAVASIGADTGIALGDPMTLRCADHTGFEAAWRLFAERSGRTLPRAAALAIASDVAGEIVALTNNHWVIDRPRLIAALGLDKLLLLNDFGAIAHAVAVLDEHWLAHLAGPDQPLPETGPISIIGPGTGLGVALLVRARDHYHVVETQGSHIAFSPLDRIEEAIRDRLRARHGRVSAERATCGPGLAEIYATLAGIDDADALATDDAELWRRALEGGDELAAAALDRFCLCLGSVAGDIALAQGARGLVLAGGLANRIAGKLTEGGFHARFIAKGRFQSTIARLPVKLLRHEHPGLYGAAAAFVRKLPGLGRLAE